MTWRNANVHVMLNCLLIGCAVLHANSHELEKEAQGAVEREVPPAGCASDVLQRIAVLESRIDATDNLMTSLTTLLNIASRRQQQQDATIGTLSTALAAKRCEHGKAGFVPKDQPTVNGQRDATKHITFNTPFSTTPQVTFGITALDAFKGANLRVRSLVSNPSPSGFYLYVGDWADSLNYEVQVDWMACS